MIEDEQSTIDQKEEDVNEQEEEPKVVEGEGEQEIKELETE